MDVTLGKHRGMWCAVWYSGGKRNRRSTGLQATRENRGDAERTCREIADALKRPTVETCETIMTAYLADFQGHSKERVEYAWEALKGTFANLAPEHVTRQLCRGYAAEREDEGRASGTIRTELGYLKTALRWHDRNTKAQVWMPPQSPPRDRHLSRAEFRKLLDASQGHMTVFLHLAIATAARREAILDLTWAQVNFEGNCINLGQKPGGKARATVPMTATVRAVLEGVREKAISEYVVEYGGRKVANIKTALRATCDRAKIERIGAHTLRHTAAVWMAGAGVPLEKISQFLGHANVNVTARVYARYQPEHLKDAADALEV